MPLRGGEDVIFQVEWFRGEKRGSVERIYRPGARAESDLRMILTCGARARPHFSALANHIRCRCKDSLNNF